MRGAACRGLPVVTGPVLTGAVTAAGAARAAYLALRRYPPAGEKTWARTNHRGEPVTLLEGPAVTVGAVTGQVITAAVAARRVVPPASAPGRAERVPGSAGPLRRLRGARPAVRSTAEDTAGYSPRGAGRGELAVAVAGLGAVAFGALDDLRGSARRRGLRGHLGALVHGEVTTGTVKLAGLAATGLACALLEGGAPADVAVNVGLIAGGANLLNLFDLRPGRAIKVAVVSAAALAAGGALAGRPSSSAVGAPVGGRGRLAGFQGVAAPVGAALALLPEDLGERAMLGDAGANALGAMLGAAAARTLPRNARLCLLTGIVALTVASEKISFTKVIEATPPLRRLDMLGRRPVPLAAPVPAGPASPAGPDARAGAVRLAWWAPRRRPGRHRRTRAVT